MNLQKQTQTLLTVTLFIMLIFSGCGDQSASEGTGTSNPSVSGTNTSYVTDDASGTDTAANESTHNETLNSLTSKVSDMISKIDNSLPTGIAEEQAKQYFDLKNEAEQLEKEVEAFEDTLETAYLKSEISREYYLEKERESERLEDLLDGAEEKLDFVFGMED